MASRYVILGFYRYLIVAEQVGCYIVELESGAKGRIIKTGEEVLTSGRGRPRTHSTNADRQRAYRQRQSVTKLASKESGHGE